MIGTSGSGESCASGISEAARPHTVVVGPYRYTVHWDQASMDALRCRIKEDVAGFVDGDVLKIFIHERDDDGTPIPADQQRETFLHELLHAVLFMTGHLDDSASMTHEEWVSSVSPSLNAVLLANPEVTAFLGDLDYVPPAEVLRIDELLRRIDNQGESIRSLKVEGNELERQLVNARRERDNARADCLEVMRERDSAEERVRVLEDAPKSTVLDCCRMDAQQVEVLLRSLLGTAPVTNADVVAALDAQVQDLRERNEWQAGELDRVVSDSVDRGRIIEELRSTVRELQTRNDRQKARIEGWEAASEPPAYVQCGCDDCVEGRRREAERPVCSFCGSADCMEAQQELLSELASPAPIAGTMIGPAIFATLLADLFGGAPAGFLGEPGQARGDMLPLFGIPLANLLPKPDFETMEAESKSYDPQPGEAFKQVTSEERTGDFSRFNFGFRDYGNGEGQPW